MTTDRKEKDVTTAQTNDVSQEEQAKAAAQLARQRIGELAQKRQGAALAALAGEPEAEAEAADIDEEIRRQERTIKLADDAAAEIARRAEERRRQQVAKDLKEARKKYDALATKRRELLEAFEEALEDLDRTAAEVVAHDRQQTAHAAAHGLPGSGDTPMMLGSRVATRLAGLLARGINHTSFLAPLTEADPNTKPIGEVEGEQAAEARERERVRAERERLRDLTDRISDRRVQLNKEEGSRDPATTDANRAAAERRVEQRLAAEFPEYTRRGE